MEEDEDIFYEDLQPFELVCTVCKGTDFIEADFIKTCADCGTHSVDLRAVAVGTRRRFECFSAASSIECSA